MKKKGFDVSRESLVSLSKSVASSQSSFHILAALESLSTEPHLLILHKSLMILSHFE